MKAPNSSVLIVTTALVVAAISLLLTVKLSQAQNGAGAAGALVAPDVPAAPDPHRGRWLDLSEDQLRAINALDPTFDADAVNLADTLRTEQLQLATLFDSADATDQAIMAQVEIVITAHDALERRVAAHVLAIRPHLTPDQQRRLMGICAQGARQGAGRFGGMGRGMGPGMGPGMGRGMGPGMGRGGGGMGPDVGGRP